MDLPPPAPANAPPYDSKRVAAAADEMEILMAGELHKSDSGAQSNASTSFSSKPLNSPPPEPAQSKGKTKAKAEVVDPTASKRFFGRSLRQRFTGLSGLGRHVCCTRPPICMILNAKCNLFPDERGQKGSNRDPERR